MAGKLVCVTGASGFIASWVVKLLLDRGYLVRATVRDPESAIKTRHLQALPGAKERLQLFRAELLEEGSFDAAVHGCDAVFHTASPFFYAITDPQKDLLDPAVKGTLNVLRAASNAKSVRRVVLTSSIASIAYRSDISAIEEVDETYWSDSEFCQRNKFWYPLSKTLAEREAWNFAKENNLDLVAINPSMVVGPLLQPTLNTSSQTIRDFLQGSETYLNRAFGFVSVKDVALAHILAYENPQASGRYIVSQEVTHMGDIVSLLQKLYPEYPVVAKPAVPGEPRDKGYRLSNKKVREELGLELQSIEESIKEAVASLEDGKFLNNVGQGKL